MSDIDALLERFTSSVEADKAAAVDRTYEIRFVGDDRRFTVSLDEGGAKARVGEGPEEACRLGLHPEDLEDLLEGKVTLSTLFSSRRMRVFGDVGDAMRLEKVLP